MATIKWISIILWIVIQSSSSLRLLKLFGHKSPHKIQQVMPYSFHGGSEFQASSSILHQSSVLASPHQQAIFKAIQQPMPVLPQKAHLSFVLNQPFTNTPTATKQFPYPSFATNHVPSLMKSQIATFKSPQAASSVLHHLSGLQNQAAPIILGQPKDQLMGHYFKNGLLPRTERFGFNSRIMTENSGIPLERYEKLGNDAKYPNYFERSAYETIQSKDLNSIKPVTEIVDEGNEDSNETN